MKNIRTIFLVLCIVFLCVFQQNLLTKTEAAPTGQVYPGGFPIGVSIDINGLLIDEICGVETEYGTVKIEGLEVGDIIQKVNDIKINTVDQLSECLESNKNQAVKLTINRKNTPIEIEVKPIEEFKSGKIRLGILAKEKVMGIGTVTYVDKEGNFGALGHAIYEMRTGMKIPFCSGDAYKCKIIGIKKGKRGAPGEIKASLISSQKIGSLKDNNDFGVYGKFDNFQSKYELLNVVSRSAVKTGPAKILLTIDKEPEYYDIEIIKCSKQSKRSPKGIIFKVTDKRLLNSASGIVQGMSGSPIIQKGNLVGAVTHVFINDPTRGYGIYLDFMD